MGSEVGDDQVVEADRRIPVVEGEMFVSLTPKGLGIRDPRRTELIELPKA